MRTQFGRAALSMIATTAVVSLVSCGDSSSSGSNGNSIKITQQALTANRWCASTYEGYLGGSSASRWIVMHHRVTVDPTGFLIWQSYGKSGGIDLKQLKKFTCRDAGQDHLHCDSQDASQVEYQVGSGALRLFVISNGERKNLIGNVDALSPCTQAQEEAFPQL